jgi:DHA2 family multidrug resistance protein-like MFS transporter
LNDTVRQIGGALGVGIFGSIMSSIYASSMSDAVKGLPAELADGASNQIGAALQIAGQLEGAASGALVAASKSAFIDGASTVYIISGIVALVGMAFVVRFMPSYDLVAGTDEETSTDRGLSGELATETVRID